MHEPQAARSLWIGNEHPGKGRSGGDARPIASPMRRACIRPQPATAARRWFHAARSALGWLQPSCSCSCAPRGRARRALCGPRADPLGPPAACGPWRSWILAAGPPSAVTEVGSLRPSRWRRLATARGRFPEMPRQKWAQVAEESGSRVSALPREACHLTHSQWRTRHTGATAATPQSASRNKRASPRSKVMRR